jgi:hypothetical protein
MKKESFKNIVITILILIIMVFIVIKLLKLNDNIKAKQLIKDSLVAQSTISSYIGKMKSDTYDVYTTQQLLLGSSDVENVDTTNIKNNNDENVLQIANPSDKISFGDSIFYKLNIDSFEKNFNLELYNEDGITWYIQSNGNIKINYLIKPRWWTQDLDAIYLYD